MKRASVSVLVPALGDTSLLSTSLPPLLAELERRGLEDELLLVDDTGAGELAPWAAEQLAEVPGAARLRVVTRDRNGGFAAAIEAGVAAAEQGLCFSMNSDVRVRPGFLDPLVEAVASFEADPTAPWTGVFAATPRVLLEGDPERDESHVACRLQKGLLTFRGLELGPAPTEVTPVPYAVGGTLLFDRARFLELGGFDELFAPFYFEDNDLCWRAARRGWATLAVPAAVVEHHHRGTIGGLMSEDRRRVAVERGELLFNWKHLDAEDLPEHLAQLYRRALDAYLTDDRAALTWLLVALERAASVGLERPAAGEPSSAALLARFQGR